jgi:hypothetical protein
MRGPIGELTRLSFGKCLALGSNGLLTVFSLSEYNTLPRYSCPQCRFITSFVESIDPLDGLGTTWESPELNEACSHRP